MSLRADPAPSFRSNDLVLRSLRQDGVSIVPALAIAGVVVGVLVAGMSARAAQEDMQAMELSPVTAPLEEAERQERMDTLQLLSRFVFERTNRVRDRYGRKQVKRDSGLVRVACVHSREMLAHGFRGHVNMRGRGPSDRVALHHRRLIGAVGENVLSQVGLPEYGLEKMAHEMVRRWMNSEEHRRNILEPDYTHMGVCASRVGQNIRVTQLFAIVRAYFRDPLPHRVTTGSTMSVVIVPAGRRVVWPESYDLWDVEADHRGSGPFSTEEPLRFPDAPGRYRVRFYFPKGDRYQIASGPEVQVVSPN